MKRLFKVFDIYFTYKSAAKEFRDFMDTPELSKFTIHRGPDHWKGETF